MSEVSIINTETMIRIGEYARLCASRGGAGEFGDRALRRPDPLTILSEEAGLAIAVIPSLEGSLAAEQ